MNITSDMTSNYEFLSADSGQKTKPIQSQFNPKQTQFKPNKAKNKPNSNPICQKAKNDAKHVFTKDYEEICEYGIKKQTQFKPNNQSSLITNHLEGKPNYQNVATADRINFLLFFFLNPMVGYADKND